MRKARELSDVFRDLKAPHAFIGGIASNVWAIPVPTYDIDVCVLLPEGSVRSAIDALEKKGFSPPASAWLDRVGSSRFRQFTVQWPFDIGTRPADIFLAEDEFQKKALSRRVEVEIETGFRAHVVTPEDLLVYKLIAFRNKDRAAIERLLAVRPDLDWDYVSEWALRFGVQDRLRQAREESNPLG